MTYEIPHLPLEWGPSQNDDEPVNTGSVPTSEIDDHFQDPEDVRLSVAQQPGSEARIRCWRRAIRETLENAKAPGDEGYRY